MSVNEIVLACIAIVYAALGCWAVLRMHKLECELIVLRADARSWRAESRALEERLACAVRAAYDPPEERTP